ncbi:MAG: DUF4350 domain-containing protein [Actinomycetaceae bacterium]|nr:DUF4350 domain-containing protein [Actinomycetaceae bacterium]
MNATPRGMSLKTFNKTWLPWILITLIGAFILGPIAFPAEREYYRGEPESTAPEGTRAAFQVLKKQGIDTKIAYNANQIGNLDHDTTLIVLPAPFLGILNTEAIEKAAKNAGRVVLIETAQHDLEQLGLYPTGKTASPKDIKLAEHSNTCEAYTGKARRAESTMRRTNPGGDTLQCFTDETGALLTIWPNRDGTDYVTLEDLSILTNRDITLHDHAALTLTLLGSLPKAVIYYEMPSDEYLLPQNQGIWPLLPPWAFWAGITLLLAATALTYAKGRRFGPLASERLPVIINAGETERAGASLAREGKHVQWALTMAQSRARRNLKKALYLPANAAEELLINTLATRTNRPAGELRTLLYNTQIKTETELQQRVEALDNLTQEVK